MKKALIVFLILAAGAAHAQSNTNASASQTSASNSTAQGTIQFSQTPEHTTETVRNVASPVLGAYAGSFSQMNCGQTVQMGAAVAGLSIVGGASHSLLDCKLEVAAFETSRQSTIASDPMMKVQLEKAAVAIRCQVSPEVYKAYIAAGLDCLGLKPEGVAQADIQPATYKVADTH